jgi:putative ABC transport system permease protein
MMTAHGLKPVGFGLVVGLALASGTTGLLQSQLFGVSARDPLTLAGTAMVLLIVAAAAAIVPAWRAARIDPATALRD